MKKNKQRGQMVFWLFLLALAVLVIAYKFDLKDLSKGIMTPKENKTEENKEVKNDNIGNPIEENTKTIPETKPKPRSESVTKE